MNPKKNNVLVTGGAGFIGSQTCKALHERGYCPIVVDNLSNGHESFVKWGPFYRGNINDKALIEHIVDVHDPIALMHFAAWIDVSESVKNPAKYYENNVKSSKVLINAVLESGIKHVVFSSTAAVYGQPESSPIFETDKLAPINPYGEGKLEVERYLKQRCEELSITSSPTYLCFRYFNAAGSDPEHGIGEAHSPETHLIPLIIDVALKRRSHISVYGDDYPTKDKTCVRDYIHVKDLAEAHVLGLEYLLEKKSSDVMNLGNGTGYSVLEIIQEVEHLLNCVLPKKIEKRRSGDPAVLIANSEKARIQLKWQPRYSELKNIIKDAYIWRKSRFF